MESLPNKFFDLQEIETEIKNTEILHINGIIVDENHIIPKDAKFGYELSKDSSAWYRYFGL